MRNSNFTYYLISLLVIITITFTPFINTRAQVGSLYLADSCLVTYPVNEWKLTDTNNYEISAMALRLKHSLNDKDINILGIDFIGSASPDGPKGWNNMLGFLRANSLAKAVLKEQTLPDSLKNILIITSSFNTDWERISKFGVENFNMLRSAKMLIKYAKIDTTSIKTIPYVKCIKSIPAILPTALTNSNSQYNISHSSANRRAVITMRTNLLYDAVLAPNLGVEFYPLHGYYTYAAEATVPWYRRDSKHEYFQMERYSIEVRRFFRTDGDFTGWYVAPYLESGLYDFEERLGWFSFKHKNAEGYKGEFVGGGFSGGYILRFTNHPHLRLEFMAGVGIIHCKYKRYTAAGSKYPYQDTRKLNYFGPTRVGVSLSWDLIFRKQKSQNRQ